MANLKSFGAANVRPKLSPLMHNFSGLCSLPFSGRTLSVESQPRIWRRVSPAVIFFRWFCLILLTAAGECDFQ
jgi:hypothetical protein